MKFVHPLGHVLGSVAGHAHTPLLQVAPMPHAWPHVPQFIASVEVSTQLFEPAHSVCVPGHAHAVTVPVVMQVAVAGQTLPQPPQFGLIVVSTH
jgi:hypothetical protein